MQQVAVSKERALVLDVDGEELVDAPEIAGRLGLKNPRQVLDLRVHRLGFPEPVARRGRKLMWSWPQVASWSDLSLAALPTTSFSAAGAPAPTFGPDVTVG